MEKYFNSFKLCTSAILTYLVYVLGGLDIALRALILVTVLDYITGLAYAYITGSLNSKVGLKGIIKKVGYFVMVALGTIIDETIGNTGAIRTLVIYFFVANEGLSIIENWGNMGLPVPKILMDKLEQLRDKNNIDK